MIDIDWLFVFDGVIVVLISTFILGVGEHGKWLYKFIISTCKKIKKNYNIRVDRIINQIKRKKLLNKLKTEGYNKYWEINHCTLVLSKYSEQLSKIEQQLPKDKIIKIRFYYNKDVDEIDIMFQNNIKSKSYSINYKYNNKNIVSLIIDEMLRDDKEIEYYTNELKNKYNDLTFENYKKLYLEIHTNLRGLIIEILDEDDRYKKI